MKEIIETLTKKSKTIATMESCTGGALASAITDIEGASEVLKFSAVTYSNEYKIKMGVDGKIIEKYTVYSIEVAKEMSKKIADFTSANYGIGITGKINRQDKYNMTNDNLIYVSIYDKDIDKYYTLTITPVNETRNYNKKLIIDKIEKILKKIV